MSGVFEFRGANKLAFESREREILLAAGAGTGKSLTLCVKVLTLLDKYPNTRGLFCRGSRASMTQTGLVTWEGVLESAGCAEVARTSTRRVRQSYEFPNGSELVCAGLDDPGKTLSSEYDFCFVGGTKVLSPSRLERGFRRPYSGKLVTVTTSFGNELTGTPNHPILTTKGWVGLGELREGDHVISRRGSEPLPQCADPDVADEPSPIAEVVRALVERCGARGTTERVETVPMNFHGDGAHGYVDVVTPLGALQDGMRPALGEPLIESFGGRAEFAKALLMGNGSGLQTRFTSLRSRNSSSTGAELPHPLSVLLGLAPGVAETLGARRNLRPPSVVGLQFLDPSGMGFGRGFPSDPALGHFLLEALDADVNGSGDGHEPRFPCEVAADRVVHVGVTDSGSGGHVYNLQTVDNWYFANNIIAHNCYIQEATEEGITLDVYETLLRSLRNGRMVKNGRPWHQMMMDCNPTSPAHWLYQRQCNGGPLRMYSGSHRDNPIYWDEAKNDYTDFGRDYIEGTLGTMTGARRARFYLGVWEAAEGLVYDGYRPAVHDTEPYYVPPREWPRVWGIDWGFVNPTALLMAAIDPDGRAVVYKEFYRTHTRAEELARWAKEEVDSGREPVPVMVVCDHDPECAATFNLYGPAGIAVKMADKGDKLGGIEATQERFDVVLPPHGDGKPRLRLVPTMLAVEPDPVLKGAGKPTGLMSEIVGYSWNRRNPLIVKDEPLDSDNHSCFVAGTMIATEFGEVPIERVQVGDRVWTRDGLRPVVAAGMTHEAAEVVTLTMSNGRTLTGTGNHPVWTEESGFVRLDDLRYLDTLQSPLPPSGTGPKKVARGTPSTPRKSPHKWNSSRWSASGAVRSTGSKNSCGTRVGSVLTHARPPLESLLASMTWTACAGAGKRFGSTDTQRKRSAPDRARASSDCIAVRALSVQREHERRPVYNLTVDGCPEYFANGVLVHNCDALRYLIREIDRLTQKAPRAYKVRQKNPFGRLPANTFQ